jgi:hypothetical protein
MNGGESHVPGVHDDGSLNAAGVSSAIGFAVLLVKTSTATPMRSFPRQQPKEDENGSPANSITN